MREVMGKVRLRSCKSSLTLAGSSMKPNLKSEHIGEEEKAQT